MEVWWSVTLPLTDTLTRRTANAETTQCAVGGEPSSIYQVLDARGRVYRGTPALPTTQECTTNGWSGTLESERPRAELGSGPAIPWVMQMVTPRVLW
jgi:hypothetical protein